MSTEFISIQPPPGASLTHWDPTLGSSHQSTSIPHTFRDAISVREETSSSASTIDDKDPRSFHWVVYASVGTNDSPPKNADGSRRSSDCTANRVPIGSIRLVPPMHAPEMKRADSITAVSPLVGEDDEHKEPYVTLDRLAVLDAYGGMGLSRLLINAAVTWAREHAAEMVPSLAPAEVEAARVEGQGVKTAWDGLVRVGDEFGVGLVDGLKEDVLWEGCGFVKDVVGWWRRMDIVDDARGFLGPIS